MRFLFHIAWRYLFAKKSHNVINIISTISAIGIALGCMVLVVILSVYNGFDNLIKSLYNSYSPNYIIEAAKGKSFTADEALIGKIREQESTLAIAPLVQDNIFCTYNGSQSVATLCGVDSLFLQRSRLADYIVDGSFSTGLGEINGAIVSSKLAITLGIRCRFTTPLMLYYPKMRRNPAASNMQELLSILKAHPSGTIQLEKSFDNGLVYIGIERARQLLQFKENEVSALYLYGPAGREEEAPSNSLTKRLREALGKEFVVKDRYMQNSTMYKMMRSEKIAVYLILLFVIIIVSFNIFGSISLLIIDKRGDIEILRSMGAREPLIKRVFMLQGFLISALGTLIGTALGVGLSLLQYHFEIIKLPGNFIIDHYPVEIVPQDLLYIVAGVLAAGYLISRLPLRKEL
ncbi:MAG: FtsX-like permease family protein [Candidatus Egerieousia sp.]|nr:FtsX-like permease family protein [bacterium]MDY5255092.1 FtsX-like permease family protein [Candidatus Egerieousia sp.]